jgi:BASS family bile acid:Na+ symporter
MTRAYGMMREVLISALQALSRHAATVLAVGVFVGLVLPDLAGWMRPLLPPAVAGLLFLALLRIDWQELSRHLSRPLIGALLCAWFLIATPVLMWAAVVIFAVEKGLATALILAAACPPIVSGPAMALLLRLDAPLMLVSVVSASLLVPFTVVVVSSHLIGVDLRIDAFELFLRLAFLIGGCVLTAVIARRLLGQTRLARCKDAFDITSVMLLLVFAVAIMDGVTVLLAQAPWHVLGFILAAFAANMLLQLLGTGVAAAMGRRSALTVGFASGNRNMGLLLAVLPADSAPDVLLFFALGQLPIYILPAVLGPAYRRWLSGA